MTNFEHVPIPETLLPLDKSHAIRNGTKDIIEGYTDTPEILAAYPRLPNDVESMLTAQQQWQEGKAIDVGESGTLLRILWFASTSRSEDREFIRRGTLRDRQVTLDPQIVDWPLQDLLTLDDGTTQYATASLIVNPEQAIPEDVDPKLKLTAEVMGGWALARASGNQWHPLRDNDAIKRQAEAFVRWKLTGDMIFEIKHSEDIPFAARFGLISAEEAEKRYPKLRKHESDRIEAIGMDANELKHSKDHRPIQAIAMHNGLRPEFFDYPEAVAKSWPEFWDFMKWVDELTTQT